MVRQMSSPSSNDVSQRFAAIRAHPLCRNTMNSGNPYMEPGQAVIQDISLMAGWLESLEACFREIEALPAVEWPTIHQIKEKFGQPCVRYSGGSGAARGAIERYLAQCTTRCQVCGAVAECRIIEGWHALLCDSHEALANQARMATMEKSWLGEDNAEERAK